jgi:hypothetical protein
MEPIMRFPTARCSLSREGFSRNESNKRKKTPQKEKKAARFEERVLARQGR